MAAAAWLVAVFAWPRLPNGGIGGADRQSSVLIAAASIMAGLIVLTVTIGTIALQVLSQFSWAVTRTIVNGRLAAASVMIAAGGGVVVPLWVALNPEPTRTRAAAVVAVWSMLILAFTVFTAAQRINPAALTERTYDRALRLITARQTGHGSHRAGLANVTYALAEVMSAPVLPDAPFRRAVLMYVGVLAVRSRAGETAEVLAAAVRNLAGAAAEATASSRAEPIVIALGGLGIDQAQVPAVHQAALDALLSIAQQARGTSRIGMPDKALDALADVADARISGLLPVWEPPTPAHPPDAVGVQRRYFGRRADAQVRETPGRRPASWKRPASPQAVPPKPSSDPAHTTLVPLKVLAGRFSSGGDVGPADVAIALASLGQQPEHVRQETEIAAEIRVQIAAARTRNAAKDDHGHEQDIPRRRRPAMPLYELSDMIENTVAGLRALLPAPSPDSTAWPAGWQGTGVLDRDVQRIARLAERPYARGQYPATSVVEETLEDIASRLQREPPRGTDLPIDRTGWRDSPTAEDNNPVTCTAMALAALMMLAFEAGFDRRALITGRRLLAAATGSAQAGDLQSLRAYEFAIQRVTGKAFLHGRSSSQAGQHRQVTVLLGLLAESDQLLACGQRPQLRETVEEITNYLVWRAPVGKTTKLAAACWQAQLLAVGWPVPPPGQLSPPEDTPAARHVLPVSLVETAQEVVTWELGDEDPSLAAASVIALWVHAADSMPVDGGLEARRIAAFLRKQVREHDAQQAELPYRPPRPGRDPPPASARCTASSAA